jgi:hypothetical protein
VSGSNCCDPERVFLFLRKPDGSFAARREVRFELPGHDPVYMVGQSHPHLLDWDGDGRTDLVVGQPGSWTLSVSAGPLAGKTEVAVKPFALPAVPDAKPWYFAFADWDGDGRFDLLAAVQYRDETDGRWHYGIFWLRNTAAKGEPTFAAPSRLLTIPAPWESGAFAVVDRGRDGCPDLVVSVSRKRTSGVESQLWLYRRKA